MIPLPAPTCNVILHGDALSVLRELPDNFVQTCISSPPYYSLRDYQVEGQIGLEATPQEYVEKLVEVFREVRRVLRKDGTAWINLGDSYAAQGGAQIDGTKQTRGSQQGAWNGLIRKPASGFKPKDLLMIPARVAIALQEDGWYLRMDCIWSKPNCLPESVTDRPTKSHEYLFLLAKSERYYYDAQAIAEHGSETSHGGNVSRGGQKQEALGRHVRSSTLGPTTWQSGRATRNKRSVWTIPTTPFSASSLGFTAIDHFAVMPPKLVEPCILAGSSAQACPTCRAPWQRITETATSFEGGSGKAGRTAEEVNASGKWAGKQYGTNLKLGPVRSVVTTGWHPSCRCPENDGSGRCIILDPFCGAGTVPLVALQHGRQYLGIELSEAYIKLAEKRIQTVQQNLWTTHGEATA